MTTSRDGTDGPCGRWLAAALVAGVLATPAAPARAQDADTLFQQGIALREAGDTAGAIDRLRRAHAIDPAPRVAYNLAVALSDRGQYVEARFLLRRLIGAGEANLLIADAARELLAQVTPRIATVRVDVEGATPAHRIVIDGARDAEAGRDITLDPGTHRIEVRSTDGAVLARSDVDLAPGERTAVVLRPVSAALASASPIAPGADGTSELATGVDAPSGGDDTWLWVGVGAGIVIVVAAVVTGTALALSGQSAAAIDGDLEDVHVGGGR